MFKEVKKIIFYTAIAVLTMNCQARTALKSQNKHRFYLLSTYTPDDVKIDKQKFSDSYRSIAKRGIIVYRNGQSYSVLVPVKSIYLKGSSNYTSNGKQTISDLGKFLSFYDADFMRFTGLAVKEAIQDSKVPETHSGLKGDYGSNKKIKSDLSRQPRKVSTQLIALKQTSTMVAALRSMSRKMANIGISVTEEIERNSVFNKGVSDKANMAMTSANSRLENASMILQEVSIGSEDLGIYADGAILIEFKKY